MLDLIIDNNSTFRLMSSWRNKKIHWNTRKILKLVSERTTSGQDDVLDDVLDDVEDDGVMFTKRKSGLVSTSNLGNLIKHFITF